MANPKGNPGNKGGRRKSAYEEFLDAQWHKEKWDNATNVKVLADVIASGNYSVRDVYLYKALTGSERLLASFGDKILPDISMLIGSNGGAVEIDLLGEAKRRLKKYEAKEK